MKSNLAQVVAGAYRAAANGLAPASAEIAMSTLEEPADVAGKKAVRHGWRVLAILSALMGFASISTDLYLPAMPEMGRDLGADAGSIELTVSGFLIGFSLGQLLWGPIGDRYGRRLPIAVGLLFFILGSAGCAMTTSAEAMVAWRVVQAVGACAGVVLSRAMVRDLYAGDRAAQMLSTLITVMAIAPLLGPIVGGQILAYTGWRAIFWTLVGVGILTLAALFTLPETLDIERRNRQPLIHALAGYGSLLADRRLLAYAGAGGFFYAGIYAYIAGTPFAYISYHHVLPGLYGVLFAAGILGIMATNVLNSRLVMQAGSARLLKWGALGAALSGTISAAAALTGFGGLWGLAVPLFVFVSWSGLIVANSIAGALADFPERAGAVSALVGALHYGSGILGSALVGILANGTPWPMGLVIGLAGIGSFACARLLSPVRHVG
ncbi:MFS transporter, DHA1 family, bicyclomycin/chloramphenicol resistance protein [Rhizobium multihospitium]|uniref:Bcr/CflA family efflux transporter n=2 Tax=Rhizobium multihospitium TaxID=410764 RepID=A0A1C3U6A8_9HYPH|nr:MFS transporter, DHA1 family, bicyclomycin/chloramphenicol resistance protein [Rhizobium multihospitium]